MRAAVIPKQKQHYDKHNPEHERMLVEYWELMMPQEKLSGRISDQWQKLGFQGNDPGTDFRAAGILALHNLVYLAKKHSKFAQEFLKVSTTQKVWLFMAVFGIHLTCWLCTFLNNGVFDNMLIKEENIDMMQAFNEIYCYSCKKFMDYWINEKPKDLMAYGILAV